MIETYSEYVKRIGYENLPKPKYDINDIVLVDMGDGTKELLTISKITKFKTPKGKFEYLYYSREYEETMPNMALPEELIIQKMTKAEYEIFRDGEDYNL
ncbi:MAG: hypothetical protein JXA99_02085 [Candidatus Lokiarchaeota archaeon]|nr:hypothetical protein [Candidatus Lokiarchaeota archaeon]